MKINLAIVILITLFAGLRVNSQTPGTKKWEFETYSSISSTPAIGSDGTIYIGANNGRLYAINSNGTLKWSFPTGSSIRSSPVIGVDGTIYISSNDKNLYAIKPDGTKDWELLTNSYGCTPVIGTKGTIYLCSLSGMHAINPNGAIIWRGLFGSGSYDVSPAVGNDGTLYIGSQGDSYFYSIYPNGSFKWKFFVYPGAVITALPAIGGDRTIYFGWRKLFAVNSDGTKKWEYDPEGAYVLSSPVIGNDNNVYIQATDTVLYAINSDGKKKWGYKASSLISNMPAIGLEGTVYAFFMDGMLTAINPDGTIKWEVNTGIEPGSALAIGGDGTLYIGSSNGKLYAFHSDSKGLANSPWPKFLKNNQNTGSSFELVSNRWFFTSFLYNTQNPSFNLEFICSKKKIEVTGLTFYNSHFKLEASIPLVIENNNTSFTLPISLSNPSAKLNKTNYQISYKIDGEAKTYTDSLEVATIINDSTEISTVGKRAIDAYYSCADTSNIAALNNRGVIYRLLGYPELAAADFNMAVSLAINNQYGFTGIKMNQGIVQSDKNNSTDASKIYNQALSDLTGKQDSSALAPIIFYNQAWESYSKADYTGTDTLASKTLKHKKANAWLKAKASTLLGAVKYNKNEIQVAKDAFQSAFNFDQAGPIGIMAKENLQALLTVIVDTSICQGENYNGLTTSGIYSKNYKTKYVCDSIVTTNLTVFPSYQPTVIQDVDTLKSVNKYKTYQWYYNFGLIPGATAQQYVVSKGGNYQLVITDNNGCTNTSQTINAIHSGINNIESGEFKYSIIPNPNKGQFTFRIDSYPREEITLELINPVGQTIEKRQVKSPELNHIERFDLSNLSKGVYYLVIESGKFQGREKILVE